MSAAAEFIYRVRGRLAGTHEGAHRARRIGAGDDYHGAALLEQGRDARRIDLRQTLRDPWERAWVREYRSRVDLPLIVIADLSASMRFRGGGNRLDMLCELVAACARSAWRHGDPFGFVACDTEVRRDLHAPATFGRAAADDLVRRLRAAQPQGSGAEGLLQAARWLPARRSLVFLVSDMHLPAALLGGTLRSLNRHEVLAVLLDDSAEREPPARWGLARLRDLESGRERLVWLRPRFARRMAQAHAGRIEAFHALCRRHGAASLVFEDRFDAHDLTRHFLSRAAA